MAVAFRMLPILLVALGALALLFVALETSPVAFFVILAAFYLPMLVFLFLCAVRAGLMALRATNAVDLKRLMTYTIRTMRLNFMLNNIIVGVLGVGTAVLAVLVLQPNLLQELREGTEIESFKDLKAIFAIVGQLPFFILPLIALGACISIGANGGSIGASAAASAARGPNHDLLFGIARQFAHLFALGFAVFALPLILLTITLGGLEAKIADAVTVGWGFLIGVCIYLGWGICVVAGGMAMSYILTLSNDDIAKMNEVSELMGYAHPPQDIRALREARQNIIDGKTPELDDPPIEDTVSEATNEHNDKTAPESVADQTSNEPVFEPNESDATGEAQSNPKDA